MMIDVQRCLRWFVAIALGAVAPLHATRLASRVFTSADGLGRDDVGCIVPDSKGFLWLCTSEGISRYDGYQFASYGVAQGLAHRSANSVLETRAGVYLVATDLGISRLDVSKPPASAQRFVTIPRADGLQSSRVYALIESRSGVVWGATVSGLYRIDDVNGARPTLRFVSLGVDEATAATTLVEDRFGTLRVGTSFGLCRVSPNGANAGRVEWLNAPPSKLPRDLVNALLIDKRGLLWAGSLSGLWKIEIAPPQPPGAPRGKRGGSESKRRRAGSFPHLRSG
jgi:ligand-binding sensor domain-containing protein